MTFFPFFSPVLISRFERRFLSDLLLSLLRHFPVCSRHLSIQFRHLYRHPGNPMHRFCHMHAGYPQPLQRPGLFLLLFWLPQSYRIHFLKNNRLFPQPLPLCHQRSDRSCQPFLRRIQYHDLPSRSYVRKL